MTESGFTATSVSSFKTLGCHAVQTHRLVDIQSHEVVLDCIFSYSGRGFTPQSPA